MKAGLCHVRDIAGDAPDCLDGGGCKLLVRAADVGSELPKDGVDASLASNVGKDVQLWVVGGRYWDRKKMVPSR